MNDSSASTDDMASVAAELKAAKALWDALVLPSAYISHLKLSKKPDPAVNSSFKLGTAAQVRVHCSNADDE